MGLWLTQTQIQYFKLLSTAPVESDNLNDYISRKKNPKVFPLAKQNLQQRIDFLEEIPRQSIPNDPNAMTKFIHIFLKNWRIHLFRRYNSFTKGIPKRNLLKTSNKQISP